MDANVPIEEAAGTVKELIQQGKVCHVGLSEASADTLRSAHAVQPVSALQSEHSLQTEDSKEEVLRTASSSGSASWTGALRPGVLTGHIHADTTFAGPDVRSRLQPSPPAPVLSHSGVMLPVKATADRRRKADVRRSPRRAFAST